MATQRFEVAVTDDHDSLSLTAAGTVSAGHIVRVEYDDTADSRDLHLALVLAAEKILQFEE